MSSCAHTRAKYEQCADCGAMWCFVCRKYHTFPDDRWSIHPCVDALRAELESARSVIEAARSLACLEPVAWDRSCESAEAVCDNALEALHASLAAYDRTVPPDDDNREALLKSAWAETFTQPWIDDPLDRTNYLLDEHERLSELARLRMDDVDELKAWRKLAIARCKLLVAYRLGTAPGKAIDDARAAVNALEEMGINASTGEEKQ